MIRTAFIVTLTFIGLVSFSFSTPAQAQILSSEPPTPVPVNLQVKIPGFDPQNQVVLGPIPAGCDKQTPSTCICDAATICVQTIGTYLNSAYRWSTGAGIIFAVVLIMIGGAEWMVGSAMGTIERAKTRIKNASLGLLFLLGASTILTFINPQITQLRPIQLPAIAASFVPTENTHEDFADEGTGNPTETFDVPQYILDIVTDTQDSNHPKNMTYFNQRTYNQSYGQCGTIRTAGCGPTSVAMIATHYNVNKDPVAVAEAFVEQGSRACETDDDGRVDCSTCQGTRWSAYSRTSDFLKENQLTSRRFSPGQKDEILLHLAEGKPILASMGCSRFTSIGHFIVLAGMNPDGTIPVKDPNSAARTQTSVEELWSTQPYIDERRNCTGKRQGLPAMKAAWLIEPIN